MKPFAFLFLIFLRLSFSVQAQDDVRRRWEEMQAISEIHYRVDVLTTIAGKDTFSVDSEVWIRKDQGDTAVGYCILIVHEEHIRFYTRGKLYFWDSRLQRGDVSSMDERWNYGFAANWSGSKSFPGFLIYENYLLHKTPIRQSGDSLVVLKSVSPFSGDETQYFFYFSVGSLFPERVEEYTEPHVGLTKLFRFSDITYSSDPEEEWRKRCPARDSLSLYLPEKVDMKALQLIDTGTELTDIPVFIPETSDTINLIRLHAGHYLLIDVMFFNCPPCRQALGTLDTIYRELKHTGLQIVSVNPVDKPLKKNYQRYKSLHASPFPLYAADPNLRDVLKVNIFPSFLLIDPKGVIRYTSPGLPTDLPAQIRRFVGP